MLFGMGVHEVIHGMGIYEVITRSHPCVPSNSALRAPRSALRACGGSLMKRATAMKGSWLYCSKNCHWGTFTRAEASVDMIAEPSASSVTMVLLGQAPPIVELEQ